MVSNTTKESMSIEFKTQKHILKERKGFFVVSFFLDQLNKYYKKNLFFCTFPGPSCLHQHSNLVLKEVIRHVVENSLIGIDRMAAGLERISCGAEGEKHILLQL